MWTRAFSFTAITVPGQFQEKPATHTLWQLLRGVTGVCVEHTYSGQTLARVSSYSFNRSDISRTSKRAEYWGLVCSDFAFS